jgi:hypothetical protein
MGEGRNVYRVLVGKLKEKYHLEDRGADGRMVSKWTLGDWLGRGGVYVECIHLAQGRDHWQALV